ncbi:MAG: ABC transporter permease [Treponema sp.]|nr:ABC transporter permease [Treponema sp.]
MLEDFLNAMQNFKRNKIRTFLSLLGVIIGVASVIVIMSMGKSSTLQIEQTFGSSGLDFVSVVTSYFSRRQSGGVTIAFDENFREELFDGVRNIKKIWYKNNSSATLSYGETDTSAQVTAVETGYLEAYGLTLDYGDFFSVTDYVSGVQKIILGSEIAGTLFPSGSALGKNITATISNVVFNFEVIGVLKEQVSGMENATNGAYVSRGFYEKKISPNPNASTVMVQATSSADATKLVDTITAFCTQKTGSEYSVNIQSMQSFIDQMNSITSTLSTMLSGIAAISLLVGGIGIMNIMIVTVTERKQEIGIRKALGAPPSLIRRQFLIESASITLIGGVLGTLLGVIISIAVEYVRSLSYVVSVPSCIVSFLFSVCVGVFFGLNPASRAAKLDPVVALTDN